MKKDNNPIIETMINTTALALTAAGTTWIITNQNYMGFVLILFGAGLEFIKYLGRRRKLW